MSGYSISGTDVGNYNFIVPTLSADITKADQTITFGTLAVVNEDDSDFDLSATTTSGLIITYVSSNPSVATISGNTVSVIGKGTTTITASQARNDIYNAATSVGQNLELDETLSNTLVKKDVQSTISIVNGSFVSTDSSLTIKVYSLVGKEFENEALSSGVYLLLQIKMDNKFR